MWIYKLCGLQGGRSCFVGTKTTPFLVKGTVESKRRRCGRIQTGLLKLVSAPATGKGTMTDVLGFKLSTCSPTKPSVLNQNLFSASIILPSISLHSLFRPSEQSDYPTASSRTCKRKTNSRTALSNFRASKHYFPTSLSVCFRWEFLFVGSFLLELHVVVENGKR